jgi:glycosyltransferase involved in cell wall biosynthesis
MNIWIAYIYEPVNGIDGDTHHYRYGELCRCLEAAGHTVTWWQSTFSHISRQNRYRSSQRIVLSERLKVLFAYGPGYSRTVSIQRVRHNRAVAREIARLIQTEKGRPDLIFAGLPCVEVVCTMASYAKTHGIPFVVDAHDMWPEIYLRVIPGCFRPFARILLAPHFSAAKKAYRTSAAFTAVSYTYLEWVQRFSGVAPRTDDKVFPLGYRLGENDERAISKTFNSLSEKHRIPAATYKITFVGSFGRFYDLETVVASARLAVSRGDTNISFILVGDGDKLSHIRQMAVDLPNVFVTGRLTQREAWAVLAHSHVGLACYKDEATQSIPYKPIEYMAAGLPQICSLKGEMRDIILRYGVGCGYNAGDPEHLLLRSTEIVADADMRRNMSIAAKALFREQFDTGKIYPALAGHLEAICAQFQA